MSWNDGKDRWANGLPPNESGSQANPVSREAPVCLSWVNYIYPHNKKMPRCLVMENLTDDVYNMSKFEMGYWDTLQNDEI